MPSQSASLEDVPGSAIGTSRKRRKTTTEGLIGSLTLSKKIRGRRGRLKQLTEMPWDVLLEIFGHLRPLDVLRLARTTKGLRSILMRRSVISVWKRARASVEGLPDCPPDMTEPQYANLLFDTHCHFCLAPNIHYIVWMARTRCCRPCWKERFQPHISHDSRTCDLPDTTYDIIPFSLQQESLPRRRRIIPYYSLFHAEKLNEEYNDVKADPTKTAEWLDEKRKRQQENLVIAASLENWEKLQAKSRSQYLDDIRKKRREFLVQKLTEIGWGDEIRMSDGALYKHELAKQPKELTERAWERIKPVMIQAMENIQADRLKAEHLEKLKARRQFIFQIRERCLSDHTVCFRYVIPPVADISQFEPFRVLVEDCMDEVVTNQDIGKALLHLPMFLSAWRRSKDQVLSRILSDSNSTDSITNTQTNLNLATTFFRCDGQCIDPIAYPRILAHKCTFSYRYQLNGIRPVFRLQPLFMELKQELWNYGGDRVSVHDHAYRVARSIVIACGLDPDITTASQMNTLDPMIECLPCQEIHQGRLVMGWRRAILHELQEHKPSAPPEWLVLQGIERKITQRLGQRQHSSLTKFFRSPLIFHCVICRRRGSIAVLFEHYKNVHNIHDVTRKDVIPDIDLDDTPAAIRVPHVLDANMALIIENIHLS